MACELRSWTVLINDRCAGRPTDIGHDQHGMVADLAQRPDLSRAVIASFPGADQAHPGITELGEFGRRKPAPTLNEKKLFGSHQNVSICVLRPVPIRAFAAPGRSLELCEEVGDGVTA